MDNQPATVGLLTEHDGFYLMDRFFARVGSLTTVDGVRQDGCLAEHLEFHDACIDRQRNRQGVLLCCPSVPLGTVLVHGTEPPPPINHRRLLGEARKFVIQRPSRKAATSRSYDSRTSLSTARPPILASRDSTDASKRPFPSGTRCFCEPERLPASIRTTRGDPAAVLSARRTHGLVLVRARMSLPSRSDTLIDTGSK